MTEYKFPVEATHIMMFARAVGDTNRIYHDQDYAQGAEPGAIIAPPTFGRACSQFDPGYHLRPRPGEPWFGSGKGPTGLPAGGEAPSSGGLHAEQHFEFHRHIKAGDVLTVSARPGESWEKEGKRSGKLRFTETIVEYRDQSGELVLTARAVGVKTEHPVERQ